MLVLSFFIAKTIDQLLFFVGLQRFLEDFVFWGSCCARGASSFLFGGGTGQFFKGGRSPRGRSPLKEPSVNLGLLLVI